MAIDKAQIVKLMNGRAQVAKGILPPLMPGYDPNIKGYDYSPDKAKALLAEAGFTATFYVIAGRVGGRGYLSPAQLGELRAAGFEIGCHSMTHRYLDEADDGQLRVELGEAKERLEQITGTRIVHFSCPGGRWSRRRRGCSGCSTSRSRRSWPPRRSGRSPA